MHAKDAALWGIENRCGQKRAEYAAVGNGKCPTSQFFHRKSTVLSFIAEFGNLLFYLRKALGISIPQHGYDQAAGRGYRNSDVKVVVVEHISAFDLGVD